MTEETPQNNSNNNADATKVTPPPATSATQGTDAMPTQDTPTQDTPKPAATTSSTPTQSSATTHSTSSSTQPVKNKPVKNKPQKAKRVRPPRAGGGGGRYKRWLWLLLVVVVIALLGWLAWCGWQRLDNRQQHTSQQLQALQQRQAANEQSAVSANQQLDDKLSTLQNQVLLHGQKISSFGQGGQSRWLLNEAKSLASLAQQRLLLTADLPATLKLLTASDATLSHMDDPRILTARKALAQDMAAVRAAQQVDTTALLLQLGAMRQQLQQLTLPEASDLSHDLTPVPSDNSHPSWWQRMLNRLPITIKRYKADLPLPLAPSQLAQARLSLSMDLQEAQLALLQGRSRVFVQALKQADSTLSQYFASTNATAKSLHAAFAKLQRVSINQALPQIGAGLEAIKALLRPADASHGQGG